MRKRNLRLGRSNGSAALAAVALTFGAYSLDTAAANYINAVNNYDYPSMFDAAGRLAKIGATDGQAAGIFNELISSAEKQGCTN